MMSVDEILMALVCGMTGAVIGDLVGIIRRRWKARKSLALATVAILGRPMREWIVAARRSDHCDRDKMEMLARFYGAMLADTSIELGVLPQHDKCKDKDHALQTAHTMLNLSLAAFQASMGYVGIVGTCDSELVVNDDGIKPVLH